MNRTGQTKLEELAIGYTHDPLVRRGWRCTALAFAITAAVLLLLPLSELLSRTPERVLHLRDMTTHIVPAPEVMHEPVQPPESVPAEPVPLPPAPPQLTESAPTPAPLELAAPALPNLPALDLSIPLPLFLAVAAPIPSPAAEAVPSVAALASTVAAEPSPQPEVHALEALDTPPKPVRQARPIYPFHARRRGVEGYVDVRFVVGVGGEVENVTVIGSSPAAVFEQAVQEALSKWSFRPGQKGGADVKTQMQIRIWFRMED